MRWINDSIATNTFAVLAGAGAFDAPVRLILGGQTKGEDYGPFARDLPANVVAAYLVGELEDEFAEAFDAAGRPYERAGTVAAAVAAAARDARPGDVVLLSPAATSFDQYRELRRARRGLPPPRGGARMKRGQVESTLLILVTLSLVAFGLVMVYSATSAPATLGGGDPGYYLKKQTVYALVGLGLLLGATRFDYRRLKDMSPLLVAGSAFLCLVVLGMGASVNGARRWLTVGPVVFQPSELAKVAIAVWAAAYLTQRKPPKTLRELARPLGLVFAVFAVLIMLEPDLGTTITLMLMLIGVLVVAGTPMRLVATSTLFVSAVGLAAIWMEPYRRERFLSFLNPWHDQLGAGFQSVQAMIGLGSGGVLGKGLGESLLKMNYLPEAHTDMIFAIIGEELGLVGVMLVLAAYAVFAWAGYSIAIQCKDPFGKRLAVALTTLDLRAGDHQHRGRSRPRTADRDPAPVRVRRRLEPRGGARSRRAAP